VLERVKPDGKRGSGVVVHHDDAVADSSRGALHHLAWITAYGPRCRPAQLVGDQLVALVEEQKSGTAPCRAKPSRSGNI